MGAHRTNAELASRGDESKRSMIADAEEGKKKRKLGKNKKIKEGADAEVC